jgi:hypothetical protein
MLTYVRFTKIYPIVGSKPEPSNYRYVAALLYNWDIHEEICEQSWNGALRKNNI